MDGDDYSRALLLASSAHLRPADPYASRGPSTHPAPPRRTGTVKFFNSSKGFGFVLDGRGIEELGGQEVFCHYSAIAGKGGFRSLAEGEEVEYDIVQGPKGFQASNLTGPGGRNVVGDPKARLAQPSPYLPFSSMSMPLSPPYNLADPYQQQRGMYSPYTQQIVYVPSSQAGTNPGSSVQYPYSSLQQPHIPHQQGSLGLQSPMMGQGIGLGSPPMLSGLSSPIGAFYAGAPGGFGGIGTGIGRETHYETAVGAYQAQQQQQQLQQQQQQQSLQNNGGGHRASPSNYFGPLSPPGGHHTALGPAPVNSFGIFGSYPPSTTAPHASSLGLVPSQASAPAVSNSTTSYGAANGVPGAYLNGANGGFASFASAVPSGMGSGSSAVGVPRSVDSRSGTPREAHREERRGTPLGNGSTFPTSAATPPLPPQNGGYGTLPPRDMSGIHLNFEGLSIESK